MCGSCLRGSRLPGPHVQSIRGARGTGSGLARILDCSVGIRGSAYRCGVTMHGSVAGARAATWHRSVSTPRGARVGSVGPLRALRRVLGSVPIATAIGPVRSGPVRFRTVPVRCRLDYGWSARLPGLRTRSQTVVLTLPLTALSKPESGARERSEWLVILESRYTVSAAARPVPSRGVVSVVTLPHAIVAG